MRTFSVVVSLLAAVGLVAAASDAAPTDVLDAKQPWYVKHASDQIVDFCFWGGMLGGGFSTFGNGGNPVGFSTVSFSRLFTQTLNVNTATTLTRTIPGSTITLFGSPGSQTVSVVSPSTETSVISTVGTPLFVSSAIADPRPTERGLGGIVSELEHYAHALAEAIVAPAEMTALFSDAANEIMRHGYIRPTKAAAYVTQASQALEVLKTDPAYSAQSVNLASQPTHIDFQRAFEHAKESHSAGIARFLGEPEGHSVGAQIRKLATSFLDTFAH